MKLKHLEFYKKQLAANTQNQHLTLAVAAGAFEGSESLNETSEQNLRDDEFDEPSLPIKGNNKHTGGVGRYSSSHNDNEVIEEGVMKRVKREEASWVQHNQNGGESEDDDESQEQS